MKFNKWIAAGAVLLVGAGAAPWGVGYVTEQQWQQATDEMNTAQPFVRVSTDDYDRGILGAETSGTLTLLDPATGDSRQIEFEATVNHGVTGSLMDFRPRNGWQPEGADWFPENEPRLTLESRVWGNATIELNMPVIEFDDTVTGESFRSSGGLARIDVSGMGEQADLLLVWPELALTTPQADIFLENIELEQEVALLRGSVWTGSGTLSLERLAAQSSTSPSVVMEELVIGSVTDAVNDNQDLNSEVTFDLASMTFEGESYGPHHLGVFVDGLDVDSWNLFSETISELQMLALQEDPDTFEQQMRLMQEVTNSLQDLVSAGLSVGVRDLSLVTPDGEVSGNLELSHPALTEAERQELLMIMPRLTGNFNLSLPVALAENDPDMRRQVAPLIKQGLLVQENGQLMMRGTLNEMVLDVNGTPMPLPPLL
ncbi:MAG: YdgA family protein [Alteromonadaceae bacterium]|nr:YdgA family protein [Alteromonadaceae bacterium]